MSYVCLCHTLTFIKVTFCDIVEPENENGMLKNNYGLGKVNEMKPQKPQENIFQSCYEKILSINRKGSLCELVLSLCASLDTADSNLKKIVKAIEVFGARPIFEQGSVPHRRQMS